MRAAISTSIRGPRVACLAAILFALAYGGASASTRSGHAVAAWPYRTLQLGITSAPGQAAEQRAKAPFGFRYQYLAGGVNTGSQTWQHWGHAFVATYIRESEAAHMVPIFSYYELRQSQPGAGQTEDSSADLINLRDQATMLAYYRNLKAFFQQAAGARGPVILHVEPDLWGFIEQAAKDNRAASVSVSVASSGMPGLQDLPNNASGLARAIVRLRDDYAPHVILAYADSIWGTGTDILLNHPSASKVAAMAATSVAFYRSLDAPFDALFTETADRDAGYAQVVNGEGTSHWWHAVDFRHLGEYIADVHRALGLPVTIWQIPVGNTLFRVENNTPYHYQDDTVQTLLGGDSAARSLLRSYARAGVAALLFGGGQSTDTCACQTGTPPAQEPAPIDGNDRRSLNGDDDGGYFMAQAAHYYRLGPLTFAR